MSASQRHFRLSARRSGDGAPCAAHRRALPRSHASLPEGAAQYLSALPHYGPRDLRRTAARPPPSHPGAVGLTCDPHYVEESVNPEAAIEPGTAKLEGAIRGPDLVGRVRRRDDRCVARVLFLYVDPTTPNQVLDE